MGQRYLIDTNTVIEYLNNKLPDNIALLIDQAEPRISVITRIELLGWQGATTEETAVLQAFLDAAVIFALEELIILETIKIRKKYRVKLPDAIIAATAIAHNLELITRNASDFQKIEDLRSLDPY